MFPTRRMLDLWLAQQGRDPAAAECLGIPLVREGRWLVNAGGRDLLGFFPDRADSPPSCDLASLRSRADALVLYDLPTGGPFHRAIAAAAGEAIELELYDCLVANTGGDFDGYEHTVLSKRSRRQFRRLRRKLSSLGSLTLEWLRPQEAEATFERFFGLLAEGVAEARQFNRNLLRRGYLEALWRDLTSDAFRVSVLSLDGTPISFRTGFVHGRRFIGYMPVYDHAFDKYSPGKLHLYLLLSRLEAEGVHEYDFSKGVSGIKTGWANSRYSLSAVAVPLRPGRGVRLRLQAWRAAHRLRRRLHDSGLMKIPRRLRFSAYAWLNRPFRRLIRAARADAPQVRFLAPRPRPESTPTAAFSYQKVSHYPLAARRRILRALYPLAGGDEPIELARDGKGCRLLCGGKEVLRWVSE